MYKIILFLNLQIFTISTRPLNSRDLCPNKIKVFKKYFTPVNHILCSIEEPKENISIENVSDLMNLLESYYIDTYIPFYKFTVNYVFKKKTKYPKISNILSKLSRSITGIPVLPEKGIKFFKSKNIDSFLSIKVYCRKLISTVEDIIHLFDLVEDKDILTNLLRDLEVISRVFCSLDVHHIGLGQFRGKEEIPETPPKQIHGLLPKTGSLRRHGVDITHPSFLVNMKLIFSSFYVVSNIQNQNSTDFSNSIDFSNFLNWARDNFNQFNEVIERSRYGQFKLYNSSTNLIRHIPNDWDVEDKSDNWKNFTLSTNNVDSSYKTNIDVNLIHLYIYTRIFINYPLYSIHDFAKSYASIIGVPMAVDEVLKLEPWIIGIKEIANYIPRAQETSLSDLGMRTNHVELSLYLLNTNNLFEFNIANNSYSIFTHFQIMFILINDIKIIDSIQLPPAFDKNLKYRVKGHLVRIFNVIFSEVFHFFIESTESLSGQVEASTDDDDKGVVKKMNKFLNNKTFKFANQFNSLIYESILTNAYSSSKLLSFCEKLLNILFNEYTREKSSIEVFSRNVYNILEKDMSTKDVYVLINDFFNKILYPSLFKVYDSSMTIYIGIFRNKEFFIPMEFPEGFEYLKTFRLDWNGEIYITKSETTHNIRSTLSNISVISPINQMRLGIICNNANTDFVNFINSIPNDDVIPKILTYLLKTRQMSNFVKLNFSLIFLTTSIDRKKNFNKNISKRLEKPKTTDHFQVSSEENHFNKNISKRLEKPTDHSDSSDIQSEVSSDENHLDISSNGEKETTFSNLVFRLKNLLPGSIHNFQDLISSLFQYNFLLYGEYEHVIVNFNLYSLKDVYYIFGNEHVDDFHLFLTPYLIYSINIGKFRFIFSRAEYLKNNICPDVKDKQGFFHWMSIGGLFSKFDDSSQLDLYMDILEKYHLIYGVENVTKVFNSTLSTPRNHEKYWYEFSRNVYNFFEKGEDMNRSTFLKNIEYFYRFILYRSLTLYIKYTHVDIYSKNDKRIYDARIENLFNEDQSLNETMHTGFCYIYTKLNVYTKYFMEGENYTTLLSDCPSVETWSLPSWKYPAYEEIRSYLLNKILYSGKEINTLYLPIITSPMAIDIQIVPKYSNVPNVLYPNTVLIELEKKVLRKIELMDEYIDIWKWFVSEFY